MSTVKEMTMTVYSHATVVILMAKCAVTLRTIPTPIYMITLWSITTWSIPMKKLSIATTGVVKTMNTAATTNATLKEFNFKTAK